MMTPRIVTVKPDTPVTYRVYLSHRLPPGKKGGIAGPICNCRNAWLVQVPRSIQQQQHLSALRKTLAQAASKMVASHHALPAESFSIAIDRAVILYRRARATRDQNLPGVDIRGEEGSSSDGEDNNNNNNIIIEACSEDADEAVRFWAGHGLAVPVWVEFYARTPPDRAHSFTVPGKALPPRGNEIAVHQALANEEAQIRRDHLAALTPVSTPTSASARTVVTASSSSATSAGSCHSSAVSDDEA